MRRWSGIKTVTCFSLSLSVSLCFMIFTSGCSMLPEGRSLFDSGSGYYEGITTPPVGDSPSVFEDNAISSNGPITVRGELLTEGPLADISGGEVSIDAKRAVITGDVVAAKVSNMRNVRMASLNKVRTGERRSAVTIRSVATMLDEYGTGADRYICTADGKIQSFKDGASTDADSSAIGGQWTFDSQTMTWEVTGEDVIITTPVLVEANLKISAKGIIFRSPLFVKQNLVVPGTFTIDAGNPFSVGLGVDGDCEIDQAMIVGKVEVGGRFTVTTLFDLIGTLKAEKEIVLNGIARINYLDLVYKSALSIATEKLGSDILLVHSQVFRDVNSRNAVALFTYSKGTDKYYEDSIYRQIEAGELDQSKFMSILQGASLSYGTSLEESDGLSSYYFNKLQVLKKLREKGYEEVIITDSLFVNPDILYHTFADTRNGAVIGTYKIAGNGLVYNDATELVVFTEENRKAVRAAMSRVAENPYAEAAASMPTEGVQEALDKSVADAKAKQTEAMSNAFPEYPLSTTEAQQVVDNSLNTEETGEGLRVNEWKGKKELLVETQTVNVTVEVAADDTSDQSAARFSWKKLKKKVSRVVKTVARPVINATKSIINDPLGFPKTVLSYAWDALRHPYVNRTDRGFIRGVNESDYDNWTLRYAVLNQGTYKIADGSHAGDGQCGPISTMMIFRWYGGEMGKTNMYVEASDHARALPTESWDERLKYDLIDIIDDLDYFNSPFSLQNAITDAIDRYGYDGEAQWKWYLTFGGAVDGTAYALYTGGFGAVHYSAANIAMYNEFEQGVDNNKPCIVNLNGFFSEYHCGKKFLSHYMPVIGYKHEICRILGVPVPFADKRYIYTHTTWSKDGYVDGYKNYKYFANKKYWRFDWYAMPFANVQMLSFSVK